MDSLTHIALGACIGEAFFDKGFGKKAMAWGALAQSIPDVDFIAAFWLSPVDNLLAHRGLTHSILFAILIVPAFASIAAKVHHPHNISLRKWFFFFSAEVFTHLFLDGFNNYGIGWLEPFNHTRYSFNIIYVADPFFSIAPGVACIILIALNSFNRRRTFWWKFGIIVPLVYIMYCTINKLVINNEVKKIAAIQHIPNEQYFTTPAPLQNWLWFVVTGNDSGYYVAYRSVFDRRKQMDFHFFPRNDRLLQSVNDQKDVLKLKQFSQQFYTIEKWTDTLVFNDLRFGQIIGWQNPEERFAFHYFIQYPEENKLVVQRGRFAKWDWNAAKTFWQRIKGN